VKKKVDISTIAHIFNKITLLKAKRNINLIKKSSALTKLSALECVIKEKREIKEPLILWGKLHVKS